MFEHKTHNKHFTVPFAQLEELYTKAGKKPKITRQTILNLTKTISEQELTQLHEADTVAMALHYLETSKV